MKRLLLLLPSLTLALSSPLVPKKIIIAGGTHGNEYTGVWCVKAWLRHNNRNLLENAYPALDVATIITNPEAVAANRRFIDTDLNREFSTEKLQNNDESCRTTVEGQRAAQLNEELGPKDKDGATPQTDCIIDLHSTTSNMGMTIIVSVKDVIMQQAAAYVRSRLAGTRILLHTHTRLDRPSLSSVARHGLSIEFGPVPQGVVRHDAVEQTQAAVRLVLEFLQACHEDRDATLHSLRQDHYPDDVVPCYRSAASARPGEMSGKLVWPTDPDLPNFPAYMIHKDRQDRDWELLRTGDPLFVDLDGNTIAYSGSHGDAVYLMFVNEGGYYYKESGTGVSVAVKSAYDFMDGSVVACQEGSDDVCSFADEEVVTN